MEKKIRAGSSESPESKKLHSHNQGLKVNWLGLIILGISVWWILRTALRGEFGPYNGAVIVLMGAVFIGLYFQKWRLKKRNP